MKGQVSGPALAALLALSFGFAASLEIVLDGEILVRRNLDKDPRWCILWNHSVAGFEVRDCYRYEDGVMFLESSHAPDFAAGLGHIPGRGRLESDGFGGYWIRDIDEPVPGNAYLLRVGAKRVDHRILHQGRSYSLSRVAAGARVIIQVKP